MVVTVVIALFLVLAMIAAGLYGSKKGVKQKSLKTIFGVNVGIFFGLMAVTTIILLSGAGAGAAGESAGGALADNSKFGLAYLSAALSTGLATIGAGIAVAMTGSAALGAISEDQSLLGKSLIIVGLAEGIAIYGLIVSILILGYVG